MKKRFTKILSVILAMLMLCMAVPMTAGAVETVASGTCGDNITWVIDSDGTLTFSGNGEITVRDPSIFEDYKDQIKTIIIDEGITKFTEAYFGFFQFSALTSIYIPSTLTEISGEALYNFTVKQYIVDKNNPYFCAEDGILFNKDKTKIVAFPAGSSATEYVVPVNITTIGNYAFAFCKNLTKVEMTDSVRIIEAGAFYACENITSIELPETIDAIENGAFYGCVALEDITVPESLTSIDSFTYTGCNIKNIVIPEGVEAIRYYAFGACDNLESVVIPSSVKYIESYVFYDSDSLTDIYYCGSEEEWNAITIDTTANENLLNANIHFNTCLHPEEDNDNTNNCSHMCHKSGIIGFFWKIINFLQKLFRTNKYCSCGAAHY